MAPPHRGGATPLEDCVLNAHFASAKRVRPDPVDLLLCPVLPPLSHETAALPTQFRPRTLPIFTFSRTSQAKSLVLASTFATWHFPLAHFFLTSHAIAQFLYRVSSPLFVALSTGCLAPSWGLLGAVLGHLGGRLGAILLLFSIQRAATQVVLPKSPSR